MIDQRLDAREKEQIRLLLDDRNHAVVSVLAEADGWVDLETLATRLVSRDLALATAAEYDERLERTIISLHHDRLPKLAAVDLVAYDRDATRVARRDGGQSDVDWQQGILGVLETHLQRPDGNDDRSIGVIEGRTAIRRVGRRFADVADGELFCMFRSSDLLTDRCVRRARTAIDRGVRMSMGSGNSEVRDLTRERLPGATVWEPQVDWTNPTTYPRLGRLVMADRRKVMLAILDEPDHPGADPPETAVVGDGATNPLVAFVRDLLGPRLDHLDYQSEDFGNRLHSYQ